MDLQFERKIAKFLKSSNKTKRDLQKWKDRKHDGRKPKPTKKKEVIQNGKDTQSN